jgi:SHAQKYF class myb-like DNA-binding protein
VKTNIKFLTTSTIMREPSKEHTMDKCGSNSTNIKKTKIRLAIIRDPIIQPNNTANSIEISKQNKKFCQKMNKDIVKIKQRRLNKEGIYNCGRWNMDEHQRFIEAIMKYGNEWKLVQKHVGTRSSTQARSHAQKFFVKLKKSQIEFGLDVNKNSIKSLHEMAASMNADQYDNAMRALNCAAFEKKVQSKRKMKRNSKDLDSIVLSPLLGENNSQIFDFK